MCLKFVGPTVESAGDTESEPKSVFQKDRVRRQQLEHEQKEKEEELARQATEEERYEYYYALFEHTYK